MLIKGLFALRVYDFLKKVYLYILIQDYMAIRDLRVHSLVTYLLFLSEQGNGEFTYCVKRGRGPNSSPLMKRGNRGEGE